MAPPHVAPAKTGLATAQSRAPIAGPPPCPVPAKLPPKRGRPVLLQATGWVRKTQYIVPILVPIARREHRDKTRRIVAILAAWRDLVGISGWTREMVDIVAEALR